MSDISKGLQPLSNFSPNQALVFNELHSWLVLQQQLPLNEKEDDFAEFRMKDNLFTI